MESRASVNIFIIFLILGPLVMESSNAEDEPTPTTTQFPPPLPNSDERKLLLECQHPDYRTYIKCLKRQKRHHWHNDRDTDGGETRKCLDECGMEQCDSTKCVHECHKKCMRRTKETHQIITQYETSCSSDDCTEKSERSELPTTNVTTNIDINNVINNHMPKLPEGRTGLGDDCGGNTGGRGGGGTGSNQPGGCTSGYPGSNSGGGLFLVPQIQFVPQITFGLGINSFAGGHWPNIQFNGIDCSSCGNPLTRYRCDVSCYSVQGSGSVIPTDGRTRGGDPNCIAPHCVGGV